MIDETPASTPHTTPSHIGRIRLLNDLLRVQAMGGRLVVTPGIAALPEPAVATIMYAITTFDAFDADNDPYDEHDFGSLTAVGYNILWKIDYYDRSLTAHSPDPTDPNVTCRVLTVMLAEEY